MKATCVLALVMLALWIVVTILLPTHRAFWLSLFLLAALLGLTWFDFDHYRIPNWISYPLILVGLAFAYTMPGAVFVLHIIGAFVGYGFIWSLNAYWQYRYVRDGIGMGDAKLFAGAGAWLGVLELPLVMLVASGSALLMIAWRSLVQKQTPSAEARIPFGPYIALGFWGVWLMSPNVGALI